MIMSDYLNAVAFATTGIPKLIDWAQDDTGVVADMRKDRKLASIGLIG